MTFELEARQTADISLRRQPILTRSDNLRTRKRNSLSSGFPGWTPSHRFSCGTSSHRRSGLKVERIF